MYVAALCYSVLALFLFSSRVSFLIKSMMDSCIHEVKMSTSAETLKDSVMLGVERNSIGMTSSSLASLAYVDSTKTSSWEFLVLGWEN